MSCVGSPSDRDDVVRVAGGVAQGEAAEGRGVAPRVRGTPILMLAVTRIAVDLLCDGIPDAALPRSSAHTGERRLVEEARLVAPEGLALLGSLSIPLAL